VILKINETSTEGVTVDEAISLIRGTAGTSVDLTLARKGSADFITVTLVREIINVPVIKTELINGVFIINLYSFSENSAQEFEKALLEFKKTKSKKLIIDVRNNPGGYLNAAIDMASHFIPQGKIVLREDQGDDQPELVYRSQGSELGLPTGIKIMVLVNEGSASASEILAGALVEHNAAQLVGTQTFGKGSVQELIPLSDGSSLKVTVAKWFTPNGVSISEKGITPTYIVTEKPTEKKPDPILEKAFSLFK
jgi:carboxyl-terminal processing protease